MNEGGQIRAVMARLLTSLIPIRSWRRKLRQRLKTKHTEEVHYPFEVYFWEIRHKQAELHRLCEETDTLFIGTSHTAYAIIPTLFSEFAYNLGSNSIDMFYAYHICRYWRKRCPRLKRVFLEYSVFSRGAVLNDGRDHAHLVYLKYLYDVNCDLPMSAEEEAAHRKNLDALLHKKPPFVESQRGYLNPPAQSIDPDRAIKHYKISRRPIPMYFWIGWLARELRQNGVELNIVIYPARDEYRAAFPPATELYAEVYALASAMGLRMFDFWDDPSFCDEDFYDYDHMTPQGAAKLTHKLHAMYEGTKDGSLTEDRISKTK